MKVYTDLRQLVKNIQETKCVCVYVCAYVRVHVHICVHEYTILELPVVHGTTVQLYVYKLFYRQLPLWLFCNALLNTVSAFRLPSVEDSIECATCALQLGIKSIISLPLYGVFHII